MVVPLYASTEQVSSRFAQLVHAAPTEADRWQRGVELAVSLVAPCDHASVTLLTPHFVETAAASDEAGRLGDGWQHELSEGPCLDSVRRRAIVVSQDLGRDVRWRSWGPRVMSGLGVRSTMSVLLDVGEETVGALNLYADRIEVWDAAQQALSVALAGRLALAAGDARLLDARARALLGRAGLGQAQGILMERLGMSADQALDHLARLAEDAGMDMTHLAERIVDDCELPRG